MLFLWLTDNAGVIVNPKGEMKGTHILFLVLYYLNAYFSFMITYFELDGLGSAIIGPIGKECADLWPRITSATNAIV